MLFVCQKYLDSGKKYGIQFMRCCISGSGIYSAADGEVNDASIL
jgi:hypothetical protein